MWLTPAVGSEVFSTLPSGSLAESSGSGLCSEISSHVSVN